MPGQYKPQKSIMKMPKCCSSFSLSMGSLDYEGNCSNEDCPLRVSFRLENPKKEVNSCSFDHKQCGNSPPSENMKKCVLNDDLTNDSWLSLMTPCGVTCSEVRYQIKPMLHVRKVQSNPDENIYANKRKYSCCMELHELDALLAELLPDNEETTARSKLVDREKTIQTDQADFANKHTNTSKLKAKGKKKKKVKSKTTKNNTCRRCDDKGPEDGFIYKDRRFKEKPMLKPVQIQRRSPNPHCRCFSNFSNQCCMTSRFLDASSRVVYPFSPCAWRPCDSMISSYPVACPCHHQWCFSQGI